jgi:hypothetical protein
LTTASSKKGPLIVVIDELDRCRPSYALEMLERVKHLFDVPNVVFLFFIHSPALHSAIQKTYGQGISSAEYLKKFFSLTIGLPVASRATYEQRDETQFIAKFIESLLGSANSDFDQQFRTSLATLAPTFKAGFRDIESALLLRGILPNVTSYDSESVGYALLLKVKNPEQLALLRDGLPSACALEVQRLRSIKQDRTGFIEYMRDVFIYGSEPATYDEPGKRAQNPTERILPSVDASNGLRDFQRLIANLSLEYVRL